MKRIIKFKAWSKKLDRFVSPDKMEHNINFGISSSIIYFDQTTGQFGEEECELVQYTGIDDKNGVEIFENDILSADWGFEGLVEWDRFIYAKTECFVSDNIQIIGNVFENPELLNN